MKYVMIALGMVMCISAERYNVDGIKVIIYGEGDTVLITQSESVRPGLDGVHKTLTDLEIEHLVSLDAKRMGFVPSEADTNRHWEDVKKQNGLTEADMQKLAAQSGYTVKEAKEQLGIMSGVNQMYEIKIRSGLFVPKSEVEAFHHANPEIQEAEYYIARAVVPFSDLEDKNVMSKRLHGYARSGKDGGRIAWSTPFWLKHSQIASEKQCIYSMSVGQISQPFELPQGFEMFKLMDKKSERLVPLKDRYDMIAQQLQRPKYDQLFKKYQDELYGRATIVRY